jgi:hypothetical protein
VLDYSTQLRLLHEEREREIMAMARARMARQGPPRTARHPLRRNVGRMLLRAGMWLIVSGAPEAFRR